MKPRLTTFILALLLSFSLFQTLLAPVAFAQEDPLNPIPHFHRARVIEVQNTNRTEEGGYQSITQELKIRLADGQESVAVFALPLGAQEANLLEAGDEIIVNEYGIVLPSEDGNQSYDYVVTDRYRFNSLLFVAGVFVVVIVLFTGFHGLRALAGLGMTVALLLYYVVPQISQGVNPLAVSLIGSLIISCISLYLAHGLNRRTTIALVSTLATLGLAIIAAVSFVSLTHLFGMGSEETLDLQYGSLTAINLRGLLLAGMIIGALGVLDDITTAQAAAVEEIYKANPKVTFAHLYQRGT